jgi:hypothetical protein
MGNQRGPSPAEPVENKLPDVNFEALEVITDEMGWEREYEPIPLMDG